MSPHKRFMHGHHSCWRVERERVHLTVRPEQKSDGRETKAPKSVSVTGAVDDDDSPREGDEDGPGMTHTHTHTTHSRQTQALSRCRHGRFSHFSHTLTGPLCLFFPQLALTTYTHGTGTYVRWRTGVSRGAQWPTPVHIRPPPRCHGSSNHCPLVLSALTGRRRRRRVAWKWADGWR